jgi:hypothetical protein
MAGHVARLKQIKSALEEYIVKISEGMEVFKNYL